MNTNNLSINKDASDHDRVTLTDEDYKKIKNRGKKLLRISFIKA